MERNIYLYTLKQKPESLLSILNDAVANPAIYYSVWVEFFNVHSCMLLS